MNRTIILVVLIGFLAWAFQGVSVMYRTIILVLLTGFLAWAFQAILPPPPNICGTPGGPPITATRIKLRDGRNLAYQEHGVPKEMAKYKVLFFPGFRNGRNDASVLTPEITEELGVYFVSFDRPGYGESDPDPNRTLKSTVFDAEELADQLGLGSKFYVIGNSMGGQLVWACLKYIPHRLAGATLIAPVVNYWLPGFPKNLAKEAYYEQLPQDGWAVGVAHYAPWLTYWWNTQKWFPPSSVLADTPKLSPQDMKILSMVDLPKENPFLHFCVFKRSVRAKKFRLCNQHANSWEFDPMDLTNPFPNNEGSVHLWHGDADWIVPVTLQRYIAGRLPWIHYHEIADAGHTLPFIDGMREAIFKALLLGEK